MIDLIKFVKVDDNTIAVFDDRHAQSLLNALRYTFEVTYIYPKMFNIIALIKTLFISRSIFAESNDFSEFFLLFKLSYKLLLIDHSKVITTRFSNITFQKLKKIHNNFNIFLQHPKYQRPLYFLEILYFYRPYVELQL